MGLTEGRDFRRPNDPRPWAAGRQGVGDILASRPRQHWVDLMEGSDVCFAPVLDPRAAMEHPHIAARGIYSEPAGVLQAAPAPRFSSGSMEPGPVPRRGEHGADILRQSGLSESEIEHLLATG